METNREQCEEVYYSIFSQTEQIARWLQKLHSTSSPDAQADLESELKELAM